MSPILTPHLKSSFKSWPKFLDAQINWLRRRNSTVKVAPQKELRHNCCESTSLGTGLRIATLPTYGQFATIGVAISAGSRNEVHYPPGTAHFLEKISFLSSEHFPDKAHTLDLLEKFGALIDCQSTRDTFVYAASCRVDNAFDVLAIIADAVLRPNILDEEVDYCRDVTRYENETLSRQPECEPLLNDWIHQAAFRSNTVGLSRYCPNDLVDAVSSKHILSFLSQYYTAPRIVLAGVGIDQSYLVEAGKELFDPCETTWNKFPGRLLSQLPPLDQSLAQYTGGEVLIEKDLSQMALGPTPFPNLAHIVIGFKGVSVNDADFVPFCVLQSLMGGGGSFSAGGPGKGMYTRLYVDVLNQHHWIYNATAFNHSYMDCGLFCIRASAEPSRLSELVDIILAEFRRLCKGVWADELERAKVQLKSQLLMNLEMRPVQFEDLARQMLAHGQRKTADEYSELIDRVQNEDVIRIAHKMLDSRLSLVGFGDLQNMPTYKSIQSKL